MNITVLTVLIEQSSQHQLLFFHYIVRRPPHSILFPTRRSSDLNTGVILGGRSFKRAAVSKDGSRFGACGHPSRRARDKVARALRMTAEFVAMGERAAAHFPNSGHDLLTRSLSGIYGQT